MSSLADVVHVARRFRKAVRVDSDLSEASALEGYVCPPSGVQILRHMAAQVAETGQGAFTWTGPYGGGKSSLALLLASLLGLNEQMKAASRSIVGAKNAAHLEKRLGGGRVVLPVVGRRADAQAAVMEAAAAFAPGRRRSAVAPGTAVAALRAVAERAPGGVLLVIDEMGKFLEAAASGGGDVYFFQELAEEAARSRGRLLVVGILHQAFDDYAHRLAREARDEWLKVQGRYSDVPLNIAADEQIELISRAIEVKGDRPRNVAAVRLAEASHRGDAAALAQRLARCWPLDPGVACLLGPLSRRRFGQSQRSIFGFLNSAEPMGFQAFLSEAGDKAVYDLPCLWDYLRANLEPSILASPDGHRWALAVDALDRCEVRGGDREHVDVVKAIALIDLFKERSGLAASRDVLQACLMGIVAKRLAQVLEQLTAWSVVIYKRHLGAFAIYAGSDFDIEAAVVDARAKMTGVDLARLKSVAMLQPILAKRFYHETGSLIWFDVDVAPLSEGVDVVRNYELSKGSAGLFLLLIGTEQESDQKTKKIVSRAVEASPGFPVVVGRCRASYVVNEAATELLALEAVRNGRSELNGDAVARREVDARVARATAELEEKVREAFASATWIASVSGVDGQKTIGVESENGAVTLNLLASKLAEAYFSKTPRIQNELLNRIKPSSNAVAAQKALLRAMIERPSEPRLGIIGFPAEGGLYAALVERTGLHVADADRDGAFRFTSPDRANASRLWPIWEAAETMFLDAEAGQVSMATIFDTWRAAPYGVRDGLLPVLGVAFVLSHLSRLSIYLDGIYQTKLSTMLVDRLTQDAASVRLRWSELSELQRTSLVALTEVVGRHGGFAADLTCPSALDTARGLVRLVNDLPNWVLRTATLPERAIQVRNLAKTANDPDKFLLDDLPAILGGGKQQDDGTGVAKMVGDGVDALISAFPNLMNELEMVMLQELRVRGRTAEALADLQARAEAVRGLTGNFRLDALAGRLASYEFAENSREAIEGIVSLAAGKPTRDWVDRDVDHARIELAALAQQFVKAEGFAHVKGREDRRVNLAIYTSDWRKDAPVKAEFEVRTSDDGLVSKLVREISALFRREQVDRDVALAVIAELGAEVANDVDDEPNRKKKRRQA